MLKLDFENAKAAIVWTTPNADQLLADMARVSAPENMGNDPVSLIGYLIRERHWSPFEMVNMCVGFVTTRDIGRQILRHDLKPQEFSQRYADVRKLGGPIIREARLQDTKNRQNSLPCDDQALSDWWRQQQVENWNRVVSVYGEALKRGIAKEVARAMLPEGNTPSLMFFNGLVRNWLHFCELRTGNGTQKECVEVAQSIYAQLQTVAPYTCEAFERFYKVNK